LEGFANLKPDTRKPDPGATTPNSSQAYVCQVAIPALIFIKADDPLIRLMAVPELETVEVSSCKVLVKKG
jgi:predicted alpha/beta-fold hydrolase